MGFEEMLGEAMGEMAAGNNPDGAIGDTAMSAGLHQQLGDDPSEADVREAVTALKEERGLSMNEANKLVQVGLGVLGDYDEQVWEWLDEAMCDTYPEYAEMAEDDK